ncbi:MAG: glycosyltransferase family 2 protein [Rhodoglobus sp.]
MFFSPELYSRIFAISALSAAVFVWLISCLGVVSILYASAPFATVWHWILGIALSLLIGTLVMGAIRNTVMVLGFLLLRHRPRLDVSPVRDLRSARVALLYCTANDFDGEALMRSMEQSHHVRTVILDDSTDPDVIARIDDFALSNKAQVVRRVTRSGFKAGNINNYLRLHPDENDFVVILDADEIIPRDFVQSALAYFARDAWVGIVQGEHRARPARTTFSKNFMGMFNTHMRVSMLSRPALGFSYFMGRGAMISMECLRATEGFPELVLEDVALSLEARKKGYIIVYSNALVSEEDFPIDYFAFKKQWGKLTEGLMEIAPRAGRSLFDPRLCVRERLDLAIEVFSTPAAGLLAILLFVAGVSGFGPAGGPALPFALGIFLAVAALIPLLPETLRVLGSAGAVQAILFLVRTSLLSAALVFVVLVAIFRVSVTGKSRFTITPKKPDQHDLVTVLSRNSIEVLCALAASIISLLLTGSLTPAIGFILGAIGGLYLSFSGGQLVPVQRPSVRAKF